jgi:murein L,D-transpeptidase YcbB/YkuD
MKLKAGLLALLIGTVLSVAIVSRRGPEGGSAKTNTATPRGADEGVRLVVNLPAYRLSVYTGGRLLRTYRVAVGRKRFATPAGRREASAIVWNPDWVPPDSAWVRGMRGVKPGMRYKAGDARNPLGKIKVVLGNGDLIHEASKPSDIGRSVSHGCVRMLREDLSELAETIMESRGWPVSPDRVEKARKGTRRLTVALSPPLKVEITYDTIVLEGDVLYVYPDVYRRGGNTAENLRVALARAGAAPDDLSAREAALVLARANASKVVAVDLAAFKAGLGLKLNAVD